MKRPLRGWDLTMIACSAWSLGWSVAHFMEDNMGMAVFGLILGLLCLALCTDRDWNTPFR